MKGIKSEQWLQETKIWNIVPARNASKLGRRAVFGISQLVLSSIIRVVSPEHYFLEVMKQWKYFTGGGCLIVVKRKLLLKTVLNGFFFVN